MFGFVRSSFQFLTVSLGSITECVFWGCSDSSLDRNLTPNVSCGLGTECYRDMGWFDYRFLCSYLVIDEHLTFLVVLARSVIGI